MSKLLTATTLVATCFLAGCGQSCESIQDEIESIGREILKNPETAMDRSEELDELRNDLVEMGCFGN